ncbi:hypothetical protein PoB_005704200 [Plakobranchus ocellatus]|uniref:Pleiotrophin/Midkine C-terminal domain-containing protein n=1 Tax=Plakobranchus ocellatus TaxID=259542 RepID=A0AAV4CG12_9GAST|nr:hypothetical protein PoB_005704200 [Plakobranchus ocellatus]
MYEDSESAARQKCRSGCAKTEEVDHCRNVARDVKSKWKWTTVEMKMEMYHDSRSGPLKKCRSRCTKTVEVDICRNIDRDVQRQSECTTAEM